MRQSVRNAMTASPHTLVKDASAKLAMSMMQNYRIRHIPVLEGGKLVGVVSDRDLKLALSLVSESGITVENLMTPDPYVVGPEAPLDDVIAEMELKKYGCAVVQDSDGKVIGIFTVIDALRVLREKLKG